MLYCRFTVCSLSCVFTKLHKNHTRLTGRTCVRLGDFHKSLSVQVMFTFCHGHILWLGFGSPLSLYESSWVRRQLFLFLRAGLYLAWSSYERGLCVDVQYIRCTLGSTCLTIAMSWSASRSHGLTFLELRAGELIFLPSCAPEGPMVPIPGHGNMATLECQGMLEPLVPCVGKCERCAGKRPYLSRSVGQWIAPFFDSGLEKEMEEGIIWLLQN